MRRLWLLVVSVLLCAIPAHGQSTTVSGQIVDSGGQQWFEGTIQFTFRVAASNPTAQYMWNGTPFSSSSTFPQNPLSLDGTGSFSGLSIPSNTAIAPAGSQWQVTVCPAATVPSCFTKLLTITGATQDISSQVVPPPVVVNLSVPLLGARAYTDAEVVGAAPGTSYYNLNDNFLHLCQITGFPPCTWLVIHGGAGTVTSVSGLSPLFTTTNPTTTPTFVLSTAAPHTWFGNNTGVTATPGYEALTTADLPAGTGTVTSINTSGCLSGGPITTTGTITSSTCVTSVSGTANQISSTGGTTPTLSLPTTLIAPGTFTATTSITDSGLTASRCVQTSTGGLLTAASGPCLTTAGFTQIQSVASGTPCTPPSSSTYDSCNFTVTWPASFADAVYNPVCWAFDPGADTGTPGNNQASNIYLFSKTASAMQVVVQNLRGAADTPNQVFCVGIHP